MYVDESAGEVEAYTRNISNTNFNYNNISSSQSARLGYCLTPNTPRLLPAPLALDLYVFSSDWVFWLIVNQLIIN